MIVPWLYALYGMTVVAAGVVFLSDEVRHNTRPVGMYEWVARAGALVTVSVLWPVVLLAGWRRQRVVPVPPRPPVELKAYTGVDYGPRDKDLTGDSLHSWILPEDVTGTEALAAIRAWDAGREKPPTPDAEEWGPVLVDPKDPQQRPHQKKPCGCARDGFLRQYATCADHQPEHAFQPAQPWTLGPGTVVPVAEGEHVADAISRYVAEMNGPTARQPDYVTRYVGDLGTWRESCGCTYADETCQAVVTYCRKHGPGLPRCDCRWDARVRRTVSCLDHQHFETPSVVLTSLPRSPQPGAVFRVGDTTFGFDGLEWARIQPVVEEGL